MSENEYKLPDTIAAALEASLVQVADQEFRRTVTLGFLAGAASMLNIAARATLTAENAEDRNRRIWILDADLSRLFVTHGLPAAGCAPAERH